MALHLSTNDMSDYMGFAAQGSATLHPVGRQAQFQQSRPINQPSVQRQISIVPAKTTNEVRQPYQSVHPQPPTQVAPNQRVHTRTAPSQSLLAARKAAMAKPVPSKNSPTTLTEASLLGPRLDHAEKTIKEVCENINAIDVNQTRIEEVVNTSWLIAEVLVDTTQYVSTDDDHEKVVSHVESTPVEANQKVSVTYPMVESKVDGKTVFLMRRRMVDPETAEVSASWIVVHSPSNDVDVDDVAYVSKFSFW